MRERFIPCGCVAQMAENCIKAHPANDALHESSVSCQNKPSAVSIATEQNCHFNFGFHRRSTKSSAFTPTNKKSKKKKLSTWCHDFICLWSTTETKPPSSLKTADVIRADLRKK